METSPDVAVIGAGPVGCVTALACAQRGARVVLLEAQAQATSRMAGEWLHPRGVGVLQRLGIERLEAVADHASGNGFVVFSEPEGPPIVLDYPEGQRGWTCEHRLLVDTLRQAAAAHPRIRFLSGARVAGIHGQKLHFTREGDHGTTTLSAMLLVGADGRSSLVRRSLGLPDDRILLSHMAGILLEDVELPCEGYGHVFLGGPGPMFVCRISPRQVRLCLDVPLRCGQPKNDAAYLWTAYSPVLPRSLQPAFRLALETRPVAWTANQWRPRAHYGRAGLALVGDAVGHFHPLTAVGMTLGFLDGYCLASSPSLSAYRRGRRAGSGVAELLAMGLYKMFTRDDAGTVAMRRAVYRMWQQATADGRLTMRLLSGEETDLLQFNRAFLKVMVRASWQLLQDHVRCCHRRVSGRKGDWTLSSGVPSPFLPDTRRTLSSFGKWLTWLVAGNLPLLLRHQSEPTAGYSWSGAALRDLAVP
jgi:2-polyprenyl-6-methoxyphenol hydroxylase-like FAD-dependent oxidoreductase